MAIEPRYPLLYRIVGSIGVLHAILGLVFAASMLVLETRFDPSMLDPAGLRIVAEKVLREDMTEAERDEVGVSDVMFRIADRMPEVMSSREFQVFFYSFITLGLVVNGLLLVACSRLVRSPPNGLGLFLVLMATCAAHFKVLPALSMTGESDAVLAFWGAWGVGNAGLSLMLGTYFWVWGPALAVIARLTSVKT